MNPNNKKQYLRCINRITNQCKIQLLMLSSEKIIQRHVLRNIDPKDIRIGTFDVVATGKMFTDIVNKSYSYPIISTLYHYNWNCYYADAIITKIIFP